MSIPSKIWRRLGFGLAVAIVALVVVRSWVIPAVIVGQIQSRLEGKVTIRSGGRSEPMVVSGAAGRLEPDASGRVLTLSGGADDPTWGHWDASGTIEPAAHRGDVRLHGPRVQADPRSLRSVAFIPAEV